MPKIKKVTLTMEELLTHALVPECEQPYQIPANWIWTRLDYIAEYKKGPFGSSITKAMFVPKDINTYKVYEQGNAIRKDHNYGNYYINATKYNELKGFTVIPGDLIVSCAGTIGEIYQLPERIYPGIINQALMRVRVKSIVTFSVFCYYFGEILTQDINLKSKGTAIKNIPPFKLLKNIPFPLPPLPEQYRIIELVDSMFEKLDYARELSDINEKIDLMKKAILARAFRGELGTNDPSEESAAGLLREVIIKSRGEIH